MNLTIKYVTFKECQRVYILESANLATQRKIFLGEPQKRTPSKWNDFIDSL